MIFKNIFYTDEFFEIKKGDILIKDNKIAAIGESIAADDDTVFDGRDKLLIPGLINTHSHVPMTLLRGLGDGLELQKWLFDVVFPIEDRLDGEAVYWSSMLGIAEMLAGGVVSFSDMYFFCDSIFEAVCKSGIKCNISRGVNSFDDRDFKDLAAFEETKNLMELCKTSDLATFEASIHAEYTSNPKLVSQIAEFAAQNGAGVHLHLSETQKEHEECKARRGKTPAQYFSSLGVFENRTTAAHCVWVEESDIEIFAAKGVGVASCPQSNLKLGSGVAPLDKMLKKGVNVTVGTDGPTSNNSLDMFKELRLAALLQRGVNFNAQLIPPKEALKMATVNAARLQGRLDAGLIKTGYRADLAVIELDSPSMMPGHDILGSVVYCADRSNIAATMVDGKILYERGSFKTIDIEKVKSKFKSQIKRIIG